MLICGFILTIVGFVAAAEYAQNSGIESLFNHKYISLPVFIGIVGLIVTLICFFGCYGSCKESSGLTIGTDLRIKVISDKWRYFQISSIKLDIKSCRAFFTDSENLSLVYKSSDFEV